MIITTPAQQEKWGLSLETETAKHIPYAYMVDGSTVETKSGHLLQVIQLDGLMAETMDDQEIDQEKHIRNSLLKSITDSSTALYFHTIRKKDNRRLAGRYAIPFADQLNRAWLNSQARKPFFINEYYITVVKKPPTGKIRRFSDVLSALSGSVNQEARRLYRKRVHNDLNKITKRIVSHLSQYGARPLGSEPCQIGKIEEVEEQVQVEEAEEIEQRKEREETEKTEKAGEGEETRKTGKTEKTEKQRKSGKIEKPGVIFSETLAFLSELINLEQSRTILPTADLSTYLPKKRLFFDKTSGTLAARGLDNRSSYAAILSIKEYDKGTAAGMLDRLLDIKTEMVISQSFSFIDKGVAKKTMVDTQRNQWQSDDSSVTESDRIDQTLEDLSGSHVSMGEHHLSILCKADSLLALEKSMSQLDTAFNELGLIAIREDAGIKPAFFAMLPANQAYITRPAVITSKNMSAFASLHNYATGQFKGNHWGEAVTLLETISGTPYFFNFHVADVANTFLIGPMGSGKTLLEAFLLAQSMKLGGRLIILDKDRGLDLFVRAMGGTYSVMNAGERTGFAPFQMEDTPDNRYFLSRLMRKMATHGGQSITDEDIDKIRLAIVGAFQLPPHDRILRHIVSFLGMRKSGSLRARFDPWVNEGDYAWLFDNDIDTLSLHADVLGFDMSAILKDPTVCHILYFYLFHHIEKRLDGTRTRIVVAEACFALQEDEIRKQIQEWSSTPRKKEAFLIMDTQSPDDIASSAIGAKIIQETVTQIYFANPNARYEDYVKKFGLSDKEYQIIRNLDKSSRFFLLKQGRRSVVVRADLSGFQQEIAILSGRTRHVKIVDKLRAEVGDDPQKWMPLYFEQIKAMKQTDGTES